jgi:putative peptide zinc metalloprotease protein
VRKPLLVLLLALLAALGPAVAPAWADDGEGGSRNDNAAVAVNLKDGASVFEFAFSVRQTMSDVIDHTNTAVAYSECEDCRTVALAVQVVLVASNPSVVTPENVAVAVNYECTSCETFAAAYQFVIGTDGPVQFTREGRRELNRIRQELRKLIRQDLPFDELDARIDELMNRLRNVLDNELVPARGDRGGDGDDDGSGGRGGSEGSGGDNGSSATVTTETQPPEDSVTTTETVTTDTGTTETDTTQTTTTGG